MKSPLWIGTSAFACGCTGATLSTFVALRFDMERGCCDGNESGDYAVASSPHSKIGLCGVGMEFMIRAYINGR